jgi:large subunit ribosomal protein L23
MNLYQVLKRPILTEKSNVLRDTENKYVFEIDQDATKLDVRRALKKIFDVDAVDVRTLILRGKHTRRGMYYGKPKIKKKAIVTVPEGQKLPFLVDAE